MHDEADAARSDPPAIELIAAIVDLRRHRTPGTIAMYALLGAMTLLVASLPVCRATQRQFARAHQLRPSSLPSWALFQVCPKMYSFAHQIWFSREPLTDYMLERPDAGGAYHETMWVNHYPIRAARFESSRAATVERGEEVHVRVRSRYRGASWTSRFVVRPDPAAPGGLVLEYLDGTP